uniref:Uncharacterized protein n=1 Tax=Vespula pensylvanica TaxID=30213 RepID=A0A834U9R4_VESPE|nr:hypothetical protein H0235_007597 [Vespula pensylvanica]
MEKGVGSALEPHRELDLAWLGLAWLGLAWLGLAWLCFARLERRARAWHYCLLLARFDEPYENVSESTLGEALFQQENVKQEYTRVVGREENTRDAEKRVTLVDFSRESLGRFQRKSLD